MNMSGSRYLALLCGAFLCGGTLAADVTAVIAWSKKVALGTLVSGVVSEVHVRPGQAVAKGEELVSLDGRSFNAQLRRREAAYRHARAALAEARREDERAAELYERTLLSDFERNQARIALASARAAAEAAHASLVQARLDLERSVIRAPFAGVVLAVSVAPGQTIVSDWQSEPLVTVADDRVLQAHAQIGADQVARLSPGEAIDATIRGQAQAATLSFIGFEPAATSDRGPLYELVAEIQVDPGRLLRVGETVTLHLD